MFGTRKLRYFTMAVLTAILGVAAVSAFGQEAVAAQKAKAEHKDKNRSFCSSTNWSSDRVNVSDLREMTIPATGKITVDSGRNGGISIKGEERNDILIRACIQAWGKTDEAARAAVAAVRVGTSGTIKAESSGEDNNWSVSYQILVPRSTSVNLTAHNGGISISGVDGTADFETTNGGVTLKQVSGAVKGRTINGGVNVVLSGGSWSGSGLDVQTTNGGVNITMPSNYAARIETGTVNGGFTSDFPALSVERDPNGRHRAVKIAADINGGGATIKVVTTNGGVRINSQ